MASAYNGDNWRDSNPDYATNLEKFYDKYK
ncbi:hypothetical protein [Paraburkholderia bengalensis]